MLYIEDNVIYLTRGDDGALEMNEITDDSGAPYTLQSGDTLTISVRALPAEDSPLLFSVTSIPGSARLLIRSADTENLAPGRYSADIQLTTPEGYRFTVWSQLQGSKRYRASNLKNFIIMPEVTTT